MKRAQSTTSTRPRLLLLGAGFEQMEALRIARELGYHTIAFDNDSDAIGSGLADEFYRLDLKDPRALLGQAKRVSPDGVFVHAAELAVEVASVAEALRLPGIGVEAARAATDKHIRIERLSSAGIRTPYFKVLRREAEVGAWQEVAREIGFPCVLKPTRQAGARGVQEIFCERDVADYHARRTRFEDERFICEERLSGLELSTESVRVNGQIRHHAIALRHYDTTACYRPFFIEDGHSLPYALPEALRREVEATIERAFEALGIESGVLKGDLLISQQDDRSDVVVLEMAGRTSGGRFADTVVPLGTGVNILYPLIEMAMGDDFSRDWFEPTRNRGVSQRFFLHPRAGRVQRWPDLKRAVGRAGVSDWRIEASYIRGGTLPAIESHRDRFGYIICTGDTREEADARALEITREFAAELELMPVTKSDPTHRRVPSPSTTSTSPGSAS